MGFFDTLRRALGGVPDAETEAPADRRINAAWGLDEPAAGEAHAPHPADSSAYDRLQWEKKLKRVLDELPGSRPEWDVLTTEARALGFDPDWVAQRQVEEFLLLVRRAVSDRVITEEEHRTIDLARALIGIPENEAEAALHAILAEAESFFDKPVQEP